MSKQQSQVTTLVLPVTGNESSDSNSIIQKYLYHWPLFLLAVIIFVGLGVFYVKVASPVYPITATLKFKTPTSAGNALTIQSTSNSLDALDPVSNPIIVENEIEVMQSKRIIYQIVKDLQLWVTYSQKVGLSTVDLYKITPVRFSFVDTITNVGTGVKLEITIKDSNSFIMKDSNNVDVVYKFGASNKSDFGTWRLDKLPLIKNYVGANIILNVQDPDLVSDNYQNSIVKIVLQDKDAPFVNLTMSDKVPERGRDVLNAVLRIYRYNAREDKNEQTQKILTFITERVDSLKNDLDFEEKKIVDYKNNHAITDLSAQAFESRTMRNRNIDEMSDLDVQVTTLNALEAYANDTAFSDRLPVVESKNLTDPFLSAVYQKLSDLQAQREQGLATMPKANPIIDAFSAQINALKKDLKSKIAAEKVTLFANRQKYQSFDSGFKSSLSVVPQQQRELDDLLRIAQKKDSLYNFLEAKREQINLHYASLIEDSEIVDDAHAGASSWPKPLIVYVIAFILGLGAAAGILYLREALNNKIISRKQIEDETEVPVLGELSYQPTSDALVVSAGRSKFAIGEQFRVLRTNLYHLHGNSDSGRVTLFTSSVSGEGKSFVSSNLAVTLAYAGRKTIILEMDLRKPKVSAIFGLSLDFAGISNYLADSSAALDPMIRPSGIAGLDVLSCGAILPNPSELLGGQRLDDLIAILKTRYDDIIIDSPPIHLVTDALIIARVANASLYVIRQGYTSKHEFDFINEVNTASRFNKFTIVFNGVRKGNAGYGYGYGYSYYSYNSYNSYTDKPKWNFKTGLLAFFKRF